MAPEERKQKYGNCGERNGMYCKTHTDEVRKKLLEINKGQVSVNKGKKASEETRQKISEKAKLKIGEKKFVKKIWEIYLLMLLKIQLMEIFIYL